jgi:Fe-S-cluster containining protein
MVADTVVKKWREMMNNRVNFCCQKQKCVKSCCGTFDGVTDRLSSIDGRTFKDIILTKKDLESIIGSQYEKYVYVAEDGIGRVKTTDDGFCSAYQSGHCMINDVKPTICQCFPLYLDVFIGLCVIKDCPSVKDKLTIESYKKEVEHFISMCEFWISHYKHKLMEINRDSESL